MVIPVIFLFFDFAITIVNLMHALLTTEFHISELQFVCYLHKL